MDLTNRDLEILYASAYSFYEQGVYPKASQLFTGLILHDPFQTRFWKGLASSKQMQKEYKAALHAWGILALLEGHKPQTHFHAAECFLSQGEKDDALKALNLAKAKLEDTSDLGCKIAQLQEELAHVC